MLPGIPGEEVLKEVRRHGKTPTIVLTAKDTIDSKVEFLRNGADDYITKPFDIQEALARVEVQLRRNNEKYEVQKLSGNGMMLDKDSYRITIDDRELETITKQEFAILELLFKNYPKKVFSKEEIFEYAWEEPYMGETKTLDVHVSNIRKKDQKSVRTGVYRDCLGDWLSAASVNLYSFFTFYLRLIRNCKVN